MTLVIGKHKGEIIAFVSDTGIVRHEERLPANQQLPKICILAPDIIVGFAGSPDLAIRALTSAPKAKDASYRQVADYFLDCHKRDGVDYLIGWSRLAPKLIVLKDGALQQNLKEAWIGDHAAFSAYQRHRQTKSANGVTSRYEVPMIATTRKSEAQRNNPTFGMIGSFRYVIQDPSIRSVFGEIVAASNADGDFDYRNYSITLEQRDIPLALPPTFRAAIGAELAELQQYAASCFVSMPSSELQGIAYHYARGKITNMFWGQRGCPLSNARVVSGMNILDFQEMTKAELNIEWRGTVELQGQPPADYGVKIDQWRFRNRMPR